MSAKREYSQAVRADRLLALLLLLQARGRTTAAALAEELEVSVRTVYRDLQALATAGVPVFAEAGPGGGCELLPGYRSPLDALTPEEADALLILGIPEPLRQLGLAGPAATARRLVDHATVGRRRAATPVVHLDMPRWFHPVDDTPHLADLARAIRDSRRIVIDYRANQQRRAKTYRLEPLGLVNKAGVWYLVAPTEQGDIVFRVGRIRSLDVTEETFSRPDDFDLEAFWASWTDDFISSRPTMSVKVRVSPEGAEVLPEVLGDSVRAALDGSGAPEADGWREIVLSFERPEVAAYRLVGLADLIEVVEPVEVRERIAEISKRALSVYTQS